jgi:saccharopine dehydrogenase-like NADP-dependent oxidoreductase
MVLIFSYNKWIILLQHYTTQCLVWDKGTWRETKPFTHSAILESSITDIIIDKRALFEP